MPALHLHHPTSTPLPAPTFSTAPLALQRLQELAILQELTRTDAVAALCAVLAEHVPTMGSIEFFEHRSAELSLRRGLALLVSVARDAELYETQPGSPGARALQRYQEIVGGQVVRLQREERASLPSMPAVVAPQRPTIESLEAACAARGLTLADLWATLVAMPVKDEVARG